MKKILSFVLTLALLAFAGCAKEAVPQGGVDGTPEEIIAKIYEVHQPLKLNVVSMELDLTDADAVAYNTGLESADKLGAAWVSEPMMGSQAYSLVVARVKDAADAPQVAKDIYDKVNTAKWICVEADTKTAAYSGDVVMFFMVGSQFAESATVDTMLEAFKTVCGGNVTVVG
ncbi:MAG: hypothetical protein ACI3XG_07830 [Faecousia sp.]